MDDDIRENLKELGKHIHDVGRQISSTKSSIQSLTAMEECLSDAADITRNISSNPERPIQVAPKTIFPTRSMVFRRFYTDYRFLPRKR